MLSYLQFDHCRMIVSENIRKHAEKVGSSVGHVRGFDLYVKEQKLSYCTSVVT